MSGGGGEQVALCRWCGRAIRYRISFGNWIHDHGHIYCKHEVIGLGEVTSPKVAEPTVFDEAGEGDG